MVSGKVAPVYGTLYMNSIAPDLQIATPPSKNVVIIIIVCQLSKLVCDR